jgi:hypothetical protein
VHPFVVVLVDASGAMSSRGLVDVCWRRRSGGGIAIRSGLGFRTEEPPRKKTVESTRGIPVLLDIFV